MYRIYLEQCEHLIIFMASLCENGEMWTDTVLRLQIRRQTNTAQCEQGLGLTSLLKDVAVNGFVNILKVTHPDDDRTQPSLTLVVHSKLLKLLCHSSHSLYVVLCLLFRSFSQPTLPWKLPHNLAQGYTRKNLGRKGKSLSELVGPVSP